jgi:hypothetical protein
MQVLLTSRISTGATRFVKQVQQFYHLYHMNLIKWLGTTGVIVATILRAFGYHTEDMIVGFMGTALWAYASYVERDRALLTCNIFILAVLLYGIFT